MRLLRKQQKTLGGYFILQNPVCKAGNRTLCIIITEVICLSTKFSKCWFPM